MTSNELSEIGQRWLREAAQYGLHKRSAIADFCGIPRITFYRICRPRDKGGHSPSHETNRKFRAGMKLLRKQRSKEGTDDSPRQT